jgi:hypothetical protein
MDAKNKQPASGRDQDPTTKATEAAHASAERDIAKDPELSSHNKNDDLDEGELARLGGGKNDLI